MNSGPRLSDWGYISEAKLTCLPVIAPRQKKKKMAQMTEHFKAPEKIQLSKEEIANLSDAQFNTC